LKRTRIRFVINRSVAKSKASPIAIYFPIVPDNNRLYVRLKANWSPALELVKKTKPHFLSLSNAK